MAQMTLNSEDIAKSLTSLEKRVAEAIEWVSRHPREIEIQLPDDLWQHYGGNFIRGGDCDSPRLFVPRCLVRAVPAERAEAEILLGVLGKKARGKARPKGKRSK